MQIIKSISIRNRAAKIEKIIGITGVGTHAVQVDYAGMRKGAFFWGGFAVSKPHSWDCHDHSKTKEKGIRFIT